MGIPRSAVGSPARAVITVIRNRNPPQFVGDPYRKDIIEDIQVDTEVIRVQAEDSDEKVSGQVNK